MLRVHNDLTRRLEPFAPANPPEVTMYACGVTVYDACHLGHARAYVAWDIVRRYLEHVGYEVRHVQNFTDIDDKIILRAAERGEEPAELTRRWEAAYFADMDRLGILRATDYPRATEYVAAMLRFIEGLMAKGHAYAVPDGSVYFDVASFPDYGRLSGRSAEDLGQRTRLDEPDPNKRGPADFALWKAAKPGEPSWTSPWGEGRPGWHLECSAMAAELLGKTLDLHVGGIDLLFPHHENEVAQSEALHDAPFVTCWLHNGFVNIDAEKMSKSLGNFRTVRELLEVHDPMAVRYFLLQTHYRQDLSFTEEALEGATRALVRLRRSLAAREAALAPSTPLVEALGAKVARAFAEAMDEDFNTPRALAALWDARAEIAGLEDADAEAAGHAVAEVRRLAAVLGLDLAAGDAGGGDWPVVAAEAAARLRDVPDHGLAAADQPEAQLAHWLEARRAARIARDFARADAMRGHLTGAGFVLADRKDGSVEVTHAEAQAWAWVWAPEGVPLA
ncbi:MAG: cysteine--tRNA ligase [Candidatus Sericytochromatia bacterium]|nr:cysteine--tRNA ligase [Candidatus Tanganyikabacteria bacterium]